MYPNILIQENNIYIDIDIYTHFDLSGVTAKKKKIYIYMTFLVSLWFQSQSHWNWYEWAKLKSLAMDDQPARLTLVWMGKAWVFCYGWPASQTTTGMNVCYGWPASHSKHWYQWALLKLLAMDGQQASQTLIIYTDSTTHDRICHRGTGKYYYRRSGMPILDRFCSRNVNGFCG